MNRKLPGLDQNIQLGSKMMVEEDISRVASRQEKWEAQLR